MGNSTSRVVGCFVPFNGKGGVDIEFLEPLDEGLGHSFCYVRPMILDSPAITPSNSERFTVDSSTLDSETLSGSFRHDTIEDPSGLNRPNKSFPETTFKTISGASVSANVSTARTGNQSALFASDAQEPAASFESTSSFAAIPLQPVPRGSGPLNGFMSGPLERGFASGPLDRAGGFMSGPIEKGVMSGPLDVADKSNFSAPLAHSRRRPGLQRLMRSVSGPMKSTLSRTFARHSMGSCWMQRFFLHPVTQFAWHPREPKFRPDASQNCLEGGPLEGEYRKARNLQWAHGKAGEDRVHVVLSEEQGWLFIGIYDGFSGPDAPDFLMSHLYRAIDKELEGLLWDYEEKSENNPVKPESPKNLNNETDSEWRKEDHLFSYSNEVKFGSSEESHNSGIVRGQLCNNEIVEEKDEILQLPSCRKPSISGTESISVSTTKLTGQDRKSMRLYELLQMESWDGQGSLPVSKSGNRSSGSCNLQSSSDVLCSRGFLQEEEFRSCSVNCKADSFRHHSEYPTTSGDDGGARVESNNQTVVAASSVSGQRQSNRKSLISSKIRQMYLKQKSLRKKLFPWSYDWHREETCGSDSIAEPLAPMRRCKSGIIDHDAVLRAMARALEMTEEAYMEMVEQALDKNPELALMGSCVLVMLMKDQDVYIMNLGDSRVILAQERPNDRHPNPNIVKDDMRHRNRSRESLVRMELDRISEESPMHNQNSQVNKVNKNREISICRLKMRAVQLSIDHSTSVEEEVLRIKAEHFDDNQAIVNDRVKGQLKVTRAFGAGFLKKPRCNEALLEMFQIGYVGTAPYISCVPSVLHHRLSSSDRFLVLSSDGLYQYFSNEEVVAHITWFMENVPEGDPAQYLIAELLFRAAKKNGMDFHELLDIPHGDRRKYHDDVSVMVVSLEGRIWRSSG
uniref:PPM-type phosphatase domain-containing protein n=1 Tax=Davidia involucrata TaxID=16924 RepID=A0A5B6ZDB7_DAVIN